MAGGNRPRANCCEETAHYSSIFIVATRSLEMVGINNGMKSCGSKATRIKLPTLFFTLVGFEFS